MKVLNIKKLTKKQKIICAVVVFIAIISVVFVWVKFFHESKKPEETVYTNEPSKQKEEPKKYYSRLTGKEIASNQLNKPVFGVMIENSPAARPQSGLADAEVIFEAIAEGGITRFLALYQNTQPEIVGPVRSVRDYYIDWASGFNASIAHVGGSYTALQRMRDGKHRDMDEMFHGASFWRSRDRYAPHNAYTSLKNLSQIASKNGWNSSDFKGFSSHKDDTPVADKFRTVQINMSSYLYNTTFKYQDDCNCYLRIQAGGANSDREKGAVKPKAVIAMIVPMSLGSDGYHNVYQDIGSGKAFLMQDGANAQEIVWSKPSETSNLTFKDAQGKEIELNRGNLWISAVPQSSGSVTVSK